MYAVCIVVVAGGAVNEINKFHRGELAFGQNRKSNDPICWRMCIEFGEQRFLINRSQRGNNNKSFHMNTQREQTDTRATILLQCRPWTNTENCSIRLCDVLLWTRAQFGNEMTTNTKVLHPPKISDYSIYRCYANVCVCVLAMLVWNCASNASLAYAHPETKYHLNKKKQQQQNTERNSNITDHLILWTHTEWLESKTNLCEIHWYCDE